MTTLSVEEFDEESEFYNFESKKSSRDPLSDPL